MVIKAEPSLEKWFLPSSGLLMIGCHYMLLQWLRIRRKTEMLAQLFVCFDLCDLNVLIRRVRMTSGANIFVQANMRQTSI